MAHGIDPPRHYRLRLYSADRSAEASRLAQRLEQAVRAACDGTFEVEIIDVLESPEQALQAHVFATPMLVKDLPEPIRRVIGDLSDTQRVLMLLDVLPAKQEPREGGP